MKDTFQLGTGIFKNNEENPNVYVTCTGLEFSFAFSTKYVFFPQENIFHKKKLVLNKARLPWKCHKETQANSYVVFPLLGFSCMFI